jgi:hypothetical protein
VTRGLPTLWVAVYTRRSLRSQPRRQVNLEGAPHRGASA